MRVLSDQYFLVVTFEQAEGQYHLSFSPESKLSSVRWGGTTRISPSWPISFELDADQRRARAEKDFNLEIGADLEDYEVTQQVFEKLVEEHTFDPCYVTHVDSKLIPLAKLNAEDPGVIDVYELIINGQEISPGYSELNDPILQKQRFEGGSDRKVWTISRRTYQLVHQRYHLDFFQCSLWEQ